MIQHSILTAKKCALISFSIGTMLFLLFCFVIHSGKMIFIGLAYILGAFIINTLVLIHILYLALTNPTERVELLYTVGIILLNIPITIGYVYLIFNFL